MTNNYIRRKVEAKAEPKAEPLTATETLAAAARETMQRWSAREFSEEQLTEKAIPDAAKACRLHLTDLIREHPDRARALLRGKM